MHLAQKITVWVLVVNMGLSAVWAPLIYLDFNLRSEWIAKNLCVNRDMPMLKCNGKCYLAMRMKATAQEKKAATPENLPRIELNFISQAVSMAQLLPPTQQLAAHCRPHNTAMTQSPALPGLLDPPKAFAPLLHMV